LKHRPALPSIGARMATVKALEHALSQFADLPHASKAEHACSASY
jgi:hypothetical protein